MNALVPLATAVLLVVPAANKDLEDCRQREAEFDYQGMIAACSIAASDPNTTREERIEANRLLGFAHTAIGDDDAAKVWFLRLLTLDPEHTLAAEVSPRFRAAFARAMEEFESEGAVSVDHTPPTPASGDAPVQVRFEVTDKLRRVARAVVEVDAVHSAGATAPVRSELSRSLGDEDGVIVYQGELPDPGQADASMPPTYDLRYRLVLENLVGDEIRTDPAFNPVSLPRTGAGTAGVGGSEGDGGGGDLLLWAGVAGVGGIVAVAAVAGGVSVGLCMAFGCGTTDLPKPAGSVRIRVEPKEATP